MRAPVKVADIATYLSRSGWRPEPEPWHRATIWSQGGTEVLVPPSDDLGDTPARVRELLSCLAVVEGRPAAAIAREMAFPLLDSASYRTLADDPLPGFVPLGVGVRAANGVRNLFGAAARAAVEGPHPRFRGGPPPEVLELLGQVQVGAGHPNEFALTLLVPVTAPVADPAAADPGRVPIGRQVLLQLHQAAVAVEQAAHAADVAAFDDTVADGVSAEFCAALGDLAGPEHERPFELAFRWAVGLPAQAADRVIAFPPRIGTLLTAASKRLTALDAPAATAVGRVQDLHDDPDGRRWRVRIRGRLHRAGRTTVRRAIWVQLDSQASYDVALAAHRDGATVRLDGTFVGSGRQEQLLARPGGIQRDQPDDL